jgi:hypothetical protein
MSTAKKAALVLAAAGVAAGAAAGSAAADSGAAAKAVDSKGFIAGDSSRIPGYAPINICVNRISVDGLLNPAVGNVCVNQE